MIFAHDVSGETSQCFRFAASLLSHLGDQIAMFQEKYLNEFIVKRPSQLWHSNRQLTPLSEFSSNETV